MGRLFKLLIIVAVVVVALFTTYEVLERTDVFEIESVQVKGSSRLSDTYLTATAAIPQGTNLLNVDTTSISARLSQNPWVGSVTVVPSFPHTLILNIEENLPRAVVQIDPATAKGSTEYWLIDSNGVWMSPVSEESVSAARKVVIESTDEQAAEPEPAPESSPEPSPEPTEQNEAGDPAVEGAGDGAADEGAGEGAPDGEAGENAEQAAQEQPSEPSVCDGVYYTLTELATIPVITGVSTSLAPVEGRQETDSGVINALDILNGVDADFSQQIATLDSPSSDNTSVMLKSGIEVAFGEAENMDAKVEVVKNLIGQYPDQISYINVRVVSRPAWRGV